MSNFIVIQDWMFKNLDLSGNDVICFGLIYGFCQDGSSYKINKTYISKVLNISRMSVFKMIKRLVDKNLIIVESYKYAGETKYKCFINWKMMPDFININLDDNGGFKDLIKENRNGGFKELE